MREKEIYLLNTLRCSICDRTNNLHVAGVAGYVGSSKRGFVVDPSDPTGNSMICLKCSEEIADASKEYFIDVESDD